jgi:Ca-activated chloride channel family protein
MIVHQRQSGIYLTCLGVGMGNYKDSKIQSLAKKGNGNFAYLDSYREAEKVLLQEFTQTLYAVADNVYMDVRFNPQYVKEYRLIGFDNKVGALKDTLSFIEGGEVGSGQSLMAVFEIIPVDNNNRKELNNSSGNYAEVNLHYNLPGNHKDQKKFMYSCPFQPVLFSDLQASYRFSAAVIMLGSSLKQTKNINWNAIIAIATESAQKGNLSQQEFTSIVQQAKIIYSKKRRKKEAAAEY